MRNDIKEMSSPCQPILDAMTLPCRQADMTSKVMSQPKMGTLGTNPTSEGFVKQHGLGLAAVTYLIYCSPFLQHTPLGNINFPFVQPMVILGKSDDKVLIFDWRW